MIWSAYTPDAKNPEKRWVWGPKWPPLSGLFHHSQGKRKEEKRKRNPGKSEKEWENMGKRKATKWEAVRYNTSGLWLAGWHSYSFWWKYEKLLAGSHWESKGFEWKGQWWNQHQLQQLLQVLLRKWLLLWRCRDPIWGEAEIDCHWRLIEECWENACVFTGSWVCLPPQYFLFPFFFFWKK